MSRVPYSSAVGSFARGTSASNTPMVCVHLWIPLTTADSPFASWGAMTERRCLKASMTLCQAASHESVYDRWRHLRILYGRLIRTYLYFI